jgi:hypothetical protein
MRSLRQLCCLRMGSAVPCDADVCGWSCPPELVCRPAAAARRAPGSATPSRRACAPTPTASRRLGAAAAATPTPASCFARLASSTPTSTRGSCAPGWRACAASGRRRSGRRGGQTAAWMCAATPTAASLSSPGRPGAGTPSQRQEQHAHVRFGRPAARRLRAGCRRRQVALCQ